MDVDIGLKLTGTESKFLATTTAFISILGELESYKSAPADLAHDQMTVHLSHYRGYYDGGKYGDRINIALRNEARMTLTSQCKRALHFLQAAATEADLPMLLQGGVTIRPRPKRKASKTTSQPQ